MKVLHVQKLGGMAGSERYLLEILPALRAAGVDARFAALVTAADRSRNDAMYRRLRAAEVPYYVLPLGRVPRASDVLGLARLVRDEQFDVLHTHLVHADFVGALARPALPRRVARVSTKHGYEERFTNEHGFDPRRVPRNAYRTACWVAESQVTASYAISRGLRRLFVESGIARREMEVIHYGFDFAAAPMQPRAEHRLGAPQITMVGRLVGFKGHRHAVDAMVHVRRAHPSAKLVIVGSGPLEDEIRASIAARGLSESVVMTGYRPDAAAFMAASDVVLVPSISEGLGVVFLEAFSAGTPVVAFDVPASNEILDHDETGLLVRPYDIDAYARAVSALLSDGALRERLAAGGAHRLRSYFTRERMTRETIAFYERASRRARSERHAAAAPAA